LTHSGAKTKLSRCDPKRYFSAYPRLNRVGTIPQTIVADVRWAQSVSIENGRGIFVSFRGKYSQNLGKKYQDFGKPLWEGIRWIGVAFDGASPD